MRFVLVALAACVLSLGACHRAPTGSTPANKAAVPDYRTTADDELGFLPADAELVIGFNGVQIRSTAMWQSFKPEIDQVTTQMLAQFGGKCGPDLANTSERMSVAIKMVKPDQISGVFVLRVNGANAMLDCMETASKKNGGTAVRDRGMVITSNPKSPTMATVSTVIGTNTFVMQIGPGASYDTMTKVLASGTPLRSSRAFMALYERREPASSLWGMANGNSPMFEALANTGMRPTTIDGTLTFSDRFAGAVRLTLASPEQAAKLGGEIDKAKGLAAAYAEKLDSRVEGSMVTVKFQLNEAQLRQLLSQMFSGL